MFSPFSTGFTVNFSTDSSREFLEVLNEVFRLVLKWFCDSFLEKGGSGTVLK